MKKTLLLLSLATSAFVADAQLTLTGTSYTQNFDGIGAGLPTGWFTYLSATATSTGIIEPPNTSVNFGIFADTISCGGPAIVVNEDFKNYPSATAISKAATCAQQKLETNRALGVRQVSTTAAAGYDPGAAFVLKLANTAGRSNFIATFKLQSLDTTCPRTTTWAVDYGIGATPTSFTPATPVGTMTTGGLTFSNNTITVNFGTALNNATSNVWIRVVALTNSTGSGNRPSSAIDDFNLTWGNTSVSDIATQPTAALTTLGNATSDNVTFGYSADETGDYFFGVYDITGRKVYTETLNVKSTEQNLTLNGLNLAPGMYIAKMNNSNSSAVTKFIIN